MRIVSYGRQMGKTVWLMSQVKKDPNRIIVCINQAEIDRLRKEYPEVKPGQFISFQEVLDGKLRGLRPEPDLYVDNLDIMLERVFGYPVRVASITTR